MALNPQFSTESINAEADALGALLDNGYLRIYSGVQPVTANDVITVDNVLLAELRFAADAFPAAEDGVITANAMTDEDAALADGEATWCRCLKADGTSPVMDGTVGTEDANVIINTTAITTGIVVSVVAPVVISVPRAGEVLAEDV